MMMLVKYKVEYDKMSPPKWEEFSQRIGAQWDENNMREILNGYGGEIL